MLRMCAEYVAPHLDDVDVVFSRGRNESVPPIAGDERLDHFLAEEIASVAGGPAGRCTAAGGPLMIFALVVIGLRFGRNRSGADQVRLVEDDNHRTGRSFDFQNLRSTMFRFLFQFRQIPRAN